MYVAKYAHSRLDENNTDCNISMIRESNVCTGKGSVSIPELHRCVCLRESPLWLCGGYHGRFGHSFSVGKRIFDDIAKERKGAFVWTVFLHE